MPDTQQSNLAAILISSFQNSEACIAMVTSLAAKGFPVIAACDPADECAADAAREKNCIVIQAEKQNALRAGLVYFHQNRTDIPGVVTLAVEEGYSIEDVIHVAEALQANPGKIIIAARASNPAMGLFARLEKFCAALAFAAVHGRSIKDPWAGLRALPSALISVLLDIKGEGGKYEFNMALNLQHKGIKTVSVPVSAEYSFKEGSQFWDRAADIFRILALPFKFISASLAATASDYAMYILFSRFILPGQLIIPLIIGRTTGGVSGYFLNRNIVFRHKNDSWKTELKSVSQFAMLFLFNLGASLLLVSMLHDYLHINDIIAKMMSDALLFIISYTVQREFIFHRKLETDRK